MGDRFPTKFRPSNFFSEGDRFMVLSFLWILLHSLVGFCLSYVQTNFWLGILFVLIFLPIYHWNLSNVGVRTNEPMLVMVCSAPTILALSWLMCLQRTDLSPIAAVASSLVAVSYSLSTIECSSKCFGKKSWAIAIATFLSCFGLALGWLVRNIFN